MKANNNRVEELLYAMKHIIPKEFEKKLREEPVWRKNGPGKGNFITISLSLSDLYPFRKWDIIEFPGNNKAIVYRIWSNSLSCYPCHFLKNKILNWIKWQWYKFYLTVFK